MDGPTRAAKPTPTAPPEVEIRRFPLTRSPIRHCASQLARVAQDRAIPPVECLVEHWIVGSRESCEKSLEVATEADSQYLRKESNKLGIAREKPEKGKHAHSPVLFSGLAAGKRYPDHLDIHPDDLRDLHGRPVAAHHGDARGIGPEAFRQAGRQRTRWLGPSRPLRISWLYLFSDCVS